MAARVTRSATKKDASSMPPPASRPKRSAATSGPTTPRKKSKPASGPASPYVPPTPNTQKRIEDEAHHAEEEGEKEGAVLLHPELKFEYEDARKHLTSVDPRWGVVMAKLKCKPFEDEDEIKKPFNPFRSLVSSLLGQQISWLAARAIQHKFCRLFFPDLPEKLPPPDSTEPRLETPFPTPQQVLSLPDRTAALRGAGLSMRKVEYTIELAERFTDGRLTAEGLWGMGDEELFKTLVECRGIGPWTVDMFSIFAAKRQDVLPVGDLGIQKVGSPFFPSLDFPIQQSDPRSPVQNLCRWYSNDPSIAPSIHPRKLVPATPTKLASSKSAQAPPSPSPSPSPVKGKGKTKKKDGKEAAVEEEFASAAAPTGDNEGEGVGVGKLAQLGVAEVEQEEVIDLDQPAEGGKEMKAEQDGQQQGEENSFVFPETSNGLTPGVLKARLNGKKLKGNIYLTPQEMEELTEAWKPYRSIACWYLWSLSDGTGDP
ncbi:hypothetical protein JCM11251_000997 [Rhodosporidiobolus azoricus]